MSCPVCGKTMQNLGSPERKIFWCSSCGTLREFTGDFSRVEMPGNLRHILAAAKLDPPRMHVSQNNTIKADFLVRQVDHEHPTIELAVYDGLERRVV